MSNAQDPPQVVATQVKLCSWGGDGGSGSLCSLQYQELQAFLSLLGESTWGLAWEGL